jgi:low affinity Fe/Cu permease
MANYNSIPRRFDKPSSNINFAYIDASLKDKQNTIDNNFGILQQSVDSVLGQDLIREEDRNYLKQKVDGVLNTLSNTDGIRFDSKKARFSIQDSLSEAAKDPEILKQVANTKKVRQVQDFYQARLKKGDINQQNFQYAYKKSGVDSYIGGTSDGVGDFQYLEYVDVDAKLDESARKIKAANPNELVSIQSIDGTTVSKKVSMLSEAEMRNHLRTQLNANDLKQLEIEGSMMYEMDDAKAMQYRNSLIKESNTKYNDNIGLLTNYRDNGNKTAGEKEEINLQIKSLESEKSFFESNMISHKTAESIGGQQLIENKVNLLSQIYTKNGPESIKYDDDFLKRMRDANAAGNIAGAGGNPNVSTITSVTDLPDEVNPYQTSLNRIDKTLAENSAYLTQTFGNLSDDKKKLVEDTMKNIKNDPKVLAMYKGQPMSNEALQLETINRLGANFFPPDIAKELRTKISSTKAIQDATQKTATEFVRSKALEENTFNQLFEKETAMTMVTPQGEVNIQQFLKKNGVTNLDNYRTFINNNSKGSKQLRATLALQSMSLTSDDRIGEAEITDNIRSLFSPLSNIGSTKNMNLTEGEYQMMRQSVHDLTSESLEETYSVKKKDGTYTLNLKNPKTKFAGIVNKTNDLYQGGRSFKNFLNPFDTDRTTRNESSLGGEFSEENYIEFASERINAYDKTTASSNSIRVQGNEDKKIVDPIIQDILKYGSNTDIDKTRPVDIFTLEDNRVYYRQAKDENMKSKGIFSKVKDVTEGYIEANDVKKMTNFNKQITMSQKENVYRTLDEVAGKVEKMSFIGNNREQVEGLNRLYDRNSAVENPFRLMSSGVDARNMIFNSSVTPYMGGAQGMAIKAQFEDFVRNTQNYKLDLSKGIDSDYQVIIENKEGDEIGTIPLGKNIDVETFEKAYQGTPQVFLAMYSQYQVKKYMDSIMTNGRR